LHRRLIGSLASKLLTSLAESIMKASRTIHALVLIAALSLPSTAFASHTYQVTGPVLEVTDKMIAVQKGKDRWEIDRDADTKIEGELKVGEKVTITYHMTAEKVEVKGSAASADKSGDKKDDKK
jgi:hypothetical protein